MADVENVKAILEDLDVLYKENPPSTRYELVVMVSSNAWIKSNKVSVWIEDIRFRGKTILCSFFRSPCIKLQQDGFLRIHGQYVIKNALIDTNSPDEDPTWAPYQLLLDEFSEISPVENRIKVSYHITSLLDVPKTIKIHEDGDFVDIVAIPHEILGHPVHSIHPRRIRLIDDSGGEITWTLWNDDAKDIKKINKLMGKPILIRRGIALHFSGFSEWQIRKELCEIRVDLCLDRMVKLKEWYDNLECLD